MTNKNIFVACDVSSHQEIINLLELIHKDISGIKIGLQYITQRSPEEIRELSKFKKPIFYDGKFFDIKNTLIESVKSLKNLNVNYATVHLLNGLDALKAANQAAQEINLNLLGVSSLTSFSDEDLKSLGFNNKVDNQVKILIKIAMEATLQTAQAEKWKERNRAGELARINIQGIRNMVKEVWKIPHLIA